MGNTCLRIDMSKQTTWSRKKKIGLAVAAVLVLAGAGGAAFYAMKNKEKSQEMAKKDAEKKPVVPQFVPAEVGRVALQVVERTVQANGSLMASRMATVRSKVAAEVRTISLRDGDSVSVGQMVAQLDPTEGQERLRSADGAVASAQARAANAKNMRDTQKALLDQNYISAAAFDGFDSTYKAALGDLATVSAQSALAKQALSDAVAKAPMSGVVAKRYVNPGEKINFDAPLVQIVDLSSLELNAWVDPELAGSLKLGQAVKVSVTGFAEELDGTLARVMPTVDSGTRQLGIIVQLKPHKLALKSGLDATARLTFASSSTASTVVPMSAMQSANGEPFVWVVTGTDAAPTVKRARVTTGIRDERLGVLAVTSTDPAALASATRVLLGRYDGLKDGQAIQFVATKTVLIPAAAASTAASSPQAVATK